MTPALQIKNLSKKFGKRLVLDNISFDVMPGEICGLLVLTEPARVLLLKL